jgi:hypothetical protein
MLLMAALNTWAAIDFWNKGDKYTCAIMVCYAISSGIFAIRPTGNLTGG